MRLGEGVFGALLFSQAILLGNSGSEQHQSTFRSVTADIAVNVAVLAGNNPVGGLTASDFEVRDNGVLQRVREVAVEGVPLDVTVIVDTSGSTARILQHLREEVREIVESLTPEDRYRLITIGTYVHEVLPMIARAEPLRSDLLQSGGLSSIYDAVGLAIMYRTHPGRRHLIAVMTDGYDTISSLGGQHLGDIARLSESVLHVLLVSPASGAPPRIPRWLPYHEFDEAALTAAAVTTGGHLHDLRPSFSAVRAFRKVLDEFRRSYVLHYTPQNVSLDGWHEVTVEVKRPATIPRSA